MTVREAQQEDAVSEAALAWVQRLIRHDTTSARSNLTLIEEVQRHFECLGMDIALTFNQDKSKANLFATIPGSISTIEGGFVLSGHTDVVPVTNQVWDTDPFAPEIKCGRLYGRGACDMKGFLGIAVSLASEFAAMKLPNPIHYALSFDEELGCLGAPLMIRDFVANGVRPRVCLVGEPTDMGPVVAHKAGRVYCCSVRGRACHSSMPQDGVNAIEYAARIITHIRELADSYRRCEAQDLGFDPPFTTISVGKIQGGIAHNTVPSECDFRFEFRSLPGKTPDIVEHEIRSYVDGQIIPQMNAEHGDVTVLIERLADIPALSERDSGVLGRLIDELTVKERVRVSYGTEAGQYQAAGVETLICGPGSIRQAHKSNEFVDLSQLAQCERFLRAVVGKIGRIPW